MVAPRKEDGEQAGGSAQVGEDSHRSRAISQVLDSEYEGGNSEYVVQER